MNASGFKGTTRGFRGEMRGRGWRRAVVALLSATLSLMFLGAAPAAAIGTGVINGTVTVTGGAAALNGSVRLEDEDGHIVGYREPNESGAFAFNSVAEGTYYLYAESFSNGLSSWYGGGDWDTAEAILVVDGQTTSIVVELDAPAQISGTVTVDGGSSAGPGEVSLYDSSGGYYTFGETGPDGYFDFNWLEAGDYYLEFTDFAEGLPEWYLNADSIETATPVTIAVGGSANVDVSLTPSAHIVGTITLDDGTPATGGEVFLYYDGTTRDAGAAAVEPDGTYDVGGLAAGDYVAQFDHFTYGVEEWYPDAEHQSGAEAIHVVTGATVTVDATLEKGGIIAGTVTSDDGCTNNGLSSWGQVSVRDGTGDVVAWEWLNQPGDFEITAVPVGSYGLWFYLPPCASEYLDGLPWYGASQAQQVAVTAGGTTTVSNVMSYPGTITGTVLLDGGGSPGPGDDENFHGRANLYTPADGATYVEFTDVDPITGTYTIEGLPPGDYLIRFDGFDNAVAEWYGDADTFEDATPVTVVASGTTVANARLSGLGAIDGVVTVEGGASATSGFVNIYDSSGDYVDYDYVGSDGAYSVTGLAPGTYYLEFSYFDNGVDEWYQDAASFDTATPVTITAGETTTIDAVLAELAAEGIITGDLTVPDGFTNPTACVGLYDSTGAYVNADCEAVGDTFTLSNLAADTYTLRVIDTDDPYASGGDWSTYAGADAWYDNAADIGSATGVPVGVGETVSIDFGWTSSQPVVLTDIAGNPFQTDIQWMADQGISTGYSDHTFRPGANVSRQAMAAFMYRFAGSPAYTPPVTSPFSDVPTDSSFYLEITWMADTTISTGYSDGTFRPGANVSRQAMAAFMYRFAESPAFTPPVTSPFSDVPTDSSFYLEITWMADTTISTGYSDGTFRPGANVTRQAMAAFMHRLDGVLTP